MCHLTSPAHFHCDLSWTNLTHKWDLLHVTPGNKERNSMRVLFVKAYFKSENYRVWTPKLESCSVTRRDTEDIQVRFGSLFNLQKHHQFLRGSRYFCRHIRFFFPFQIPTHILNEISNRVTYNLKFNSISNC